MYVNTNTIRAIIIPLGGCEPFGQAGAVGAGTVCVDGIAKEVSIKCKVLTAPTLPFGCSTPFISFPGAAGIKPRTFINALCEIIHSYIFQGIIRIFLINAAPFNREPICEVIKRIEGKYPAAKVFMYDINTIMDPLSIHPFDPVREKGGHIGPPLRGAKNHGIGRSVGFDRDDALILSLLAYLRPDMYRGFVGDNGKMINTNINPTPDKYRVWKKRGRDPEKLRKLFPEGLLLSPDSDIMSITPDQGKRYFGEIVESIQKSIQSALESIPSNDTALDDDRAPSGAAAR